MSNLSGDSLNESGSSYKLHGDNLGVYRTWETGLTYSDMDDSELKRSIGNCKVNELLISGDQKHGGCSDASPRSIGGKNGPSNYNNTGDSSRGVMDLGLSKVKETEDEQKETFYGKNGTIKAEGKESNEQSNPPVVEELIEEEKVNEEEEEGDEEYEINQMADQYLGAISKGHLNFDEDSAEDQGGSADKKELMVNDEVNSPERKKAPIGTQQTIPETQEKFTESKRDNTNAKTGKNGTPITYLTRTESKAKPSRPMSGRPDSEFQTPHRNKKRSPKRTKDKVPKSSAKRNDGVFRCCDKILNGYLMNELDVFHITMNNTRDHLYEIQTENLEQMFKLMLRERKKLAHVMIRIENYLSSVKLILLEKHQDIIQMNQNELRQQTSPRYLLIKLNSLGKILRRPHPMMSVPRAVETKLLSKGRGQ